MPIKEISTRLPGRNFHLLSLKEHLHTAEKSHGMSLTKRLTDLQIYS